ncbi:type VI secretion system membrane subunit TssM [Lysobacter enzymogenes]|uniref:type VI secretion system membrane subunit TssM n=1 Tax=Lysobacter enzymogenes TaxID=69 RepID=UPI001F5283FE|nr:type VI secretion system membrane subunit TssM [Lysobacter enzymogenes]UZW58407.1 type VI secretion system membrane subunit TssM [Lysobacter enzymogenes]
MMSYLYRFIDFMRRKGLTDLAAFALTVILVWTGGPYFGTDSWYPLRSVQARLILIGAIGAGWLLWRGWRWWRERRAAGEMAQDLAAPAGEGADSPAARAGQEQARLRARFAEAMELLRKRKRRDGRGLDTLPWYLLIGAPGAGKSTLLQNSGLDFPLKEHFGGHTVAGIGGTRQCDWWFADQAVFIDSAGRYTTQDSDATADGAAWQTFLGLLRKHRRRPLNGVIVAVSASDLLDPDEDRRRAHARAVRRRLDELGERLRATVPVYLVLTKCDLISGFGDFFAELDGAGRDQVWGTTFPHGRDAPADPTTLFAAELELLLGRIDARALDRLQAFRDPQRRAGVLSFPQQLRLLQPQLQAFVHSAFGAHGYADQPWLRGVYFTSGTQHGHPIDRVLSTVARVFGLAPSRLPAPADKPRTFFVGRLLNEVMFAEAGLAGGYLGSERRKRALQVAAWVGLGAATLTLLFCLIGSYTNNRQRIGQVRDALADYPMEALPDATTEQEFYARALQRFDVLERTRNVAEPPGQPVPWSYRFGLYRGASLGADVQAAYLRDLNAVMLPALAQSLHLSLSRSSGDPQWLYQLLKGYLMLGQPARRDVGHLSALAATHWRRTLSDDPALRAALDRHLRALFAGGARALPLDERQIERARETLHTAEIPTLVYGGLVLARSGATPREAAPVRLDRKLGLLGEVFQRRSGTALSEPLPALYTRQAFAELSGGGIERAVREFLAEDWVLGGAKLDALARLQLTQQVLALYQRDYIAAWDRVLADIELRPVVGMGEASAVAAKLGGPGSPLKALLELVREHTHGLHAAKPARDKGAKAGGSAQDRSAADTDNEGGAGQGGDAAGEPIGLHFEPFNRLLSSEGGAMPLDQTMTTLTQMSRSLLSIGAGVGGVDQNDPALLIAAQQAEQLPAPASQWVAALAGRSRSLAADSAGESMRAGLRQSVGADCGLFVNGRYPFDPGASSEIPLRDFAELFAGGGRFDRFFQQSLAAKVDTGARRWQWKDGMREVEAGDVLARAQLADQIRQAYFGSGGLPQVAFTVSVAPQPGIGRVQLEVDGQSLEYADGVAARQSMTWPGPRAGFVKISAWDEQGQPLASKEYRGAWSWFRALQDGRLRREGDLNYVADIALGSAQLRIGVLPGSLRHPFADASVQRFRCP